MFSCTLLGEVLPEIGRAVERCRVQGKRPTVKILISDPWGRCISFSSDKSNSPWVKLPGGGIKKGEDIIACVIRECEEEMIGIPPLHRREIGLARIGASGIVRSSIHKKGPVTKVVWVLYGVITPSLDSIKPINGKGLRDPVIHKSPNDMLRFLDGETVTPVDERMLYRNAVLALASTMRAP